jgi:NitT/TauT family transport system substrate-binding protein
MRTRWSRVFGALAVVGMLAFGAGSPARASSVALHHRAMVDITLQLKWENQAQFAGYYVAADKGFYAQQGLNVTIRPGGPDVVPEQVVASRAAEFGIDWLSALLVAREKGVPIQNIAQIFQASGMRLIAFKSEHINSIQDFKGKKVGVWPSGNEYQFYALMYKYHLWPPSHYMTVANQPFEMTPFLTHQLDVAHAMTYNELGVVLESGVKRSQLTVFDYNKLGVSILEDGIFARPDWLRSHKDIAVRFLRASIKGWQWVLAHPKDAGILSYKHAPNSPGGQYHQIYMATEVAKLINYGAAIQKGIGYMDPKLFHRTWSTLLNEHVIAHPPKNAYNQTYWQAAISSM